MKQSLFIMNCNSLVFIRKRNFIILLQREIFILLTSIMFDITYQA